MFSSIQSPIYSTWIYSLGVLLQKQPGHEQANTPASGLGLLYGDYFQKYGLKLGIYHTHKPLHQTQTIPHSKQKSIHNITPSTTAAPVHPTPSEPTS